MFDDDRRPATAFRITVNGEPYGEAEDLTTLTIAVDEVRRRAQQRVTLYAAAGGGQLHWMTADLHIGDRIAIEVVDAAALERGAEPRQCDFCAREDHEVSSLIQGRSGTICDVCIAALGAAVHKGSALPLGASRSQDSALICRFCGETPLAVGAVVVRNGSAVCAECLRTCVDMLSGTHQTHD